MTRAAILLLPLLLCGCAALPIAMGTAGGALSIAGTAVSLANNSLSLAAKLACALQAEANARGDARLSETAGTYCVW